MINKIKEILKSMKIDNYIILKILIYSVLFVIYIFPTGLIKTSIPIDKLIFVIITTIIYFGNLLNSKKITKKHIIFISAILIFNIIGKTINYFLFLPILLVDDIIEQKEKIINILKETKILYICLIFTIIYSIINFGKNGRYAYTSIMEINQSGLAIFCLSMMLMIKNKKLAYVTLAFGLLTISRSYYLATIIYMISKIKFINNIVCKNKLIKLCNYTNLTILSSIGLIIIGILYIYQYKAGNIYWGDDISNRLYNFLDYSNFFRFTTIIILLLIFIKKPKKIILGINNNEFNNIGKIVANDLDIPYKYLMPHNLFYSHLRLYGIFSILETIYISNIMKKIINTNNFLIFIAIVLYSFILGAGLYSYWLYLSVFMLICKEQGE